MLYIRFLKPPGIVRDHKDVFIKSLFAVTSDFGDQLCAQELSLVACLSAKTDGRIVLQTTLRWSPEIRCLPVVFDITGLSLPWPVRVCISPDSGTQSTQFAYRGGICDLPRILLAWSDVLDLHKGIKNAAKTVERRFRLGNGKTFSIWEDTGESIARHLWYVKSSAFHSFCSQSYSRDAGVALAAFLDFDWAVDDPKLPLLVEHLVKSAGKRLQVLELGCGCGIVGISLANIVPNCEVLLTDMPEAEEIVQKNIACTTPAERSALSFVALDWEKQLPEGIRERDVDLILVADCIYNPDSSPALVQTILALVSYSPRALLVLAVKFRHPSEKVFFKLMRDNGFVTEDHASLLSSGDDNDHDPEFVRIYLLRLGQPGVTQQSDA